MNRSWYVTVEKSGREGEYLPLAGPFKTHDDAQACVDWCKTHAIEIDANAGDYLFQVKCLWASPHLRLRGVFTPRGNLFTPWFRGLIP